MKPEAQEADMPKRQAQRQQGLLRAQAVDQAKETFLAATSGPDMWAGVGSSVSNFVMGANKAASQTYSAASLLGSVK